MWRLLDTFLIFYDGIGAHRAPSYSKDIKAGE